ncbi:MAG: hypothetical protein ACYCZQ_15485 [Burkholderiales bacterium]
MDWLAQNWVWVVVFAVFIGMHLFGHGGHGGRGGHGGHGGHGGCGGGDDQRPADGAQPGKDKPQGHQH